MDTVCKNYRNEIGDIHKHKDCLIEFTVNRKRPTRASLAGLYTNLVVVQTIGELLCFWIVTETHMNGMVTEKMKESTVNIFQFSQLLQLKEQKADYRNIEV